MALTFTPIHARAFLPLLAFLIALSTLEELACHAQEEEYVVAFDVDQDKDPGESGQPEEDDIFTGSPLVDTPYKQEHFIPTQTQEEAPLLQQVDYHTNHTGNKTAFLEIHITHHMARASSNRSQGVGLFPVVFNLATRAKITTNATCGENGPEPYCRLVEHVLRRPTHSIQCGTCDEYGNEHHPVENAIDGSNRWWQSPSIANGIRYNWVTLTLDLGQAFQVAYVIVKAANSPRPGNWILERSLDGQTFRPWQYYALSDSECWNGYGVRPTIGIPRFTTDDQVICTSFYSRLDPLENGEIHTSLVNGRPGVDGPSDLLQEFTSARYIRLQFQRIRTLNADLMTFMSNDPRDLDSSVTNRYFYSIKDISVGGQCICYGHASQCPIDPQTGEMRCKCEKNTCGKSCGTCCPLFNQFPWKQGTYSEGGGCESCLCYGHATSCVFNQTVADHRLSLSTYDEYEGGGVCVDCQHNTMGINCELCSDGFYRPSDVDHWDVNACRPCDCDTHGATGHCVKDDSKVLEGQCAGDCFCNEGFAGPKCSHCAAGWHGYPACEQCPCSQAGSLNVDACEGDCVCKPNVCGPFCDQCNDGYFNLQESNPDGCTQCFCFDLVDQCHSMHWGSKQITTLENWEVTDEAGVKVEVEPSPDGHLVVDGSSLSHLDRVRYWSAPWQYTGNKMLSYGGKLVFHFHYWLNFSATPDELNNNYLGNHDVILEGNGMRLGHQGRYYREHQDNIVRVNVTEGEWRHMAGSRSSSGGVVLREELLMALANVSRLLLRATHHAMQTEARLKSMRLDEAAEDGRGPVMSAVELCECPQGYAGTSCEQCAEGYRRVDNQLLGGLCQPCQCNGHSERCDPFTGHCLDCTDNTGGPRCDQCAPGFYGDPQKEGCKPCRCPLEAKDNNFAAGCAPDPATPDVDFVCYGCRLGYEGDYCERCSDGYYGNPLVPGSHCQPCDCHGNADAAAGGRCDRESGECLVCLHHTEGAHCEKCMLGYYGTAHNGDCSPCACDRYGAIGDLCDAVTGLCRCRDGYRGRDCGSCMPGHGNTVAGCPVCRCDVVGALSDVCDAVTGQCSCQTGVGGLSCDQCSQGFYNFGSSGCISCGCDSDGTNGTDCNPFSGQCVCKPHVAGVRCEHCANGFWGLRTDGGCQSCDCDVLGSDRAMCDAVNGQCTCLPGVGGRRCDQCLPGYYGLTSSGCKQCRVCRAPGQVCDRVTGECVCPPNTEGELCERCAFESWGHDPLLGCKKCACNSTGAADNNCDVLNGQCVCREGYAGPQCGRCTFGHFGFPRCQPCHCDIAGTQLSACDSKGHCQCDEKGHCPCKENVAHKKCRYCKRGSFSLEAQNPMGCTSCFCFGRSDTCSQGDFAWSKVTFPGRQVVIEPVAAHTVSPDPHRLMVIPLDVTEVNVDEYYRPIPLYWTLPKEALGDKTLSYNGRLRFTAEYDIGEHKVAPPPSFALVQLVGAYRLHLQYVLDSPPSDRGYYEVLLREDLWQDSDGQSVSREKFMVALQNLQQLLIFASPHAHVTHTRLEAVSLDLAVPTRGGLSTAVGVEKCVCPREYEGASCQNPSSGYYRERPSDFMDSEDLVDLTGHSTPCICHGHAFLCDTETGRCLECVHSTEGDQCQRCARGYYGNATHSTAYDCQMCACPLFAPLNNFSPTCYGHPDEEFVCDACEPGYEGVHCQKCSTSYYGNPQEIGGLCRPCACNREGSLTPDLCDPVSGSCSCIPGIWGRACDKCEDRYALIGGRCTSCDVGCPAMLMAGVDDLEHMVTNYNETSLALWPYKYLATFKAEVERQQIKLDHSNVNGLKRAMREVDELKLMVREVQDKAHVVTRGDEMVTEAREQRLIAESLARSIEDTHRQITGEIGELTSTVTERLLNQSGNTRYQLEDAELILAEMKEGFNREEGEPHRQVKADGELGNAQASLDRMQELAKRETNVSGVEVKVEDTSSKLRDMRVQVDRATDRSVQTELLNRRNKQRLTAIQDLKTNVQTEIDTIRAANRDADKLKEEAAFLVYNKSRANYQQVACMGSDSPDLEDYSDGLMDEQACEEARQNLRRPWTEVEEKSGLLEQNLPEAKVQLQKALSHADDLEYQANNLEEQFALTRESAADPLRAAEVYDNIKDAVLEAETAAREASTTAEDVILKNDMAKGGPLPGQAVDAVKTSKSIVANASRLNTDPLEERLNISKREMAATKYDQDRMIKELDHIKYELNNITSGVNRAVRVLAYRADNTVDKATEVLDKVKQKHQIINEEMAPKVKELEKILEGNPLSRANASLEAAKESIRKVVNMTEMLNEHMMLLEAVNSNISGSIQQLRDNIQLAREQANNIKVSLQTDGECVRRYSPPIEPTNRNNIVMHFKTDHSEDNMMLLFVGKEEESDFMTLELVDRHVQFSWDMGGGARTIVHPLTVESASEKEKEEEKWYKVIVERISSTVKLSVYALSSNILEDPDQVVDVSESSFTQLNLDTTAHLFVGGVTSAYKLPRSVENRAFRGCLGGVQLDGKHVGLYNFRVLEKEGTCSGCASVPSEDYAGEGFQFDGTGFSEMPPLRGFNPASLTSAVSFKTFWREAQLYFSVSEETGDFASMELQDGHVVFRYRTGPAEDGRRRRRRNEGQDEGQDWQMVRTKRMYNTNEWTTASATFSQKEGVVLLKVGDEEIYADLPTDSDQSLDLANCKHYYGGVHPDIDLSKYGIETTKFLGCIRNAKVASRGSYRQNLMASNHVGVKDGCSSKVARTTGFHGDGFTEHLSPDFPEKSDISFSFRTLQEEALLLILRGTSHTFMSFSLTGGRFAAWFNMGEGLVTLETSTAYNDGFFHSVSVLREDEKLTVYVDDEMIGEVQLPAGSGPLRARSDGGLYLGGLPPGVDLGHMAASTERLKGCLSSLIIDQQVIVLDEPLNFAHADVGRCDEDVLFPGLTVTEVATGSVIPSFTVTITLPDSPGPTPAAATTQTPEPFTTAGASLTTTPYKPPESCGVQGATKYYSEAVAFGDVINSHAEIVVKRREVNRDFNITLDFKTYYNLSLLLYVTNEAQSEFIAVQLAEGQVHVSYHDKGVTRNIKADRRINDGVWHTLMLEKNRKSIMLKVDNDPGIRGRITRRVDVIAPLYVGGVPKVYKLRQGLIAESFKGCMREFYLNGRRVDLINSKAIMGVRPCFMDVEEGVHFDGFGHAIYSNEFEVRSVFKMAFDFRTTNWNGVLMSISDPRTYPALGLEMVGGQLAFRAVNSEGPFSVKSEECRFCLCDNRWHHVEVAYRGTYVYLRVDGGTMHTRLSPGGPESLDTYHQLFLGGFPVYANPQGATTTGEFFQGCIKNLFINDARAHWHNMYQLQAVHISACPLPNPK